MNLISSLLVLTAVSILIGYLVSQLSIFKTKRWFRILFYVLFTFLNVFPCVIFLDYFKQDVGNAGFIAGILSFWFYIGTRIVNDIQKNKKVQRFKNGYGVFMIIMGGLTIMLNLINYGAINALIFYIGFSQILFGYFLQKKPLFIQQ